MTDDVQSVAASLAVTVKLLEKQRKEFGDILSEQIEHVQQSLDSAAKAADEKIQSLSEELDSVKNRQEEPLPQDLVYKAEVRQVEAQVESAHERLSKLFLLLDDSKKSFAQSLVEEIKSLETRILQADQSAIQLLQESGSDSVTLRNTREIAFLKEETSRNLRLISEESEKLLNKIASRIDQQQRMSSGSIDAISEKVEIAFQTFAAKSLSDEANLSQIRVDFDSEVKVLSEEFNSAKHRLASVVDGVAQLRESLNSFGTVLGQTQSDILSQSKGYVDDLMLDIENSIGQAHLVHGNQLQILDQKIQSSRSELIDRIHSLIESNNILFRDINQRLNETREIADRNLLKGKDAHEWIFEKDPRINGILRFRRDDQREWKLVDLRPKGLEKMGGGGGGGGGAYNPDIVIPPQAKTLSFGLTGYSTTIPYSTHRIYLPVELVATNDDDSRMVSVQIRVHPSTKDITVESNVLLDGHTLTIVGYEIGPAGSVRVFSTFLSGTMNSIPYNAHQIMNPSEIVVTKNQTGNRVSVGVTVNRTTRDIAIDSNVDLSNHTITITG